MFVISYIDWWPCVSTVQTTFAKIILSIPLCLYIPTGCLKFCKCLTQPILCVIKIIRIPALLEVSRIIKTLPIVKCFFSKLQNIFLWCFLCFPILAMTSSLLLKEATPRFWGLWILPWKDSPSRGRPHTCYKLHQTSRRVFFSTKAARSLPLAISSHSSASFIAVSLLLSFLFLTFIILLIL